MKASLSFEDQNKETERGERRIQRHGKTEKKVSLQMWDGEKNEKEKEGING
jgi:hypothetical protein